MQKTKQPQRLEPIKPGTTAYVLKRLKESWPWYLMLLPAVVYLIIFDYVPMAGNLMAFQDYRPSKGIFGSPFVGFKHFKRFFNYVYFGDMIVNTLRITLLSLCTFPCSIIFALFLNEVTHTKYKKFAQMISYMPHFLSEVVVVSLVLLLLDVDTGPINKLIELFGGEAKYFMGDAKAFPLIYVLQSLWQSLGWGAILYISALSSVDAEQIEAARIDGASRFQIMWHINLPSILPTVTMMLILKMGGILNVGYEKILLLYQPITYEVADVISTYVYRKGLLEADFSYSTAVGLFNSVVNLFFLFASNKLSKYVGQSGLF